MELGNRPYTIAGRFDELRDALELPEPGRCFRHCESAWKKDPLRGVIGVQKGPLC